MDHFSSLVLKRTKSWIQDLFASTAFEGRRIWFVILVTIFDLATFCVHAVKHSTLTTHHQFYSSMCAKCGSIACSIAGSPFQVLTFMHTWSVRAVYFIFQFGHMCDIYSPNIASCPVSQSANIRFASTSSEWYIFLNFQLYFPVQLSLSRDPNNNGCMSRLVLSAWLQMCADELGRWYLRGWGLLQRIHYCNFCCNLQQWNKY